MEDRNTEFLNTLLSEYTPSSYENFNGAYNNLIKVAIVILNWNGQKMLAKYLPNVIEYSRQDAEI